MAHIDYRNDILKHYIRKHGWLPACKSQKSALKRHFDKFPLRYFTFCASEAIDVFMLAKERILKRSKDTGTLEGVFFCEKDPEAFGKIAGLIGSTSQGFLGEFDKIVLFEDDADTKDRSIEDEIAYDDNVRKKLQHKDAHTRVKAAFPFDIINFDVCGVMFPLKKGVFAPLLESFVRILEWQTNELFSNGSRCQQFTAFLTSHIDPGITDQEAILQLTGRLAQNIDTFSDFKAAFLQRYKHISAAQLAEDNFAEFFSLAFPKFIIHKALFDLGWDVTHGPTFLYNRPDLYVKDRCYQMMHSVSVYKRMPGSTPRLDGPELGRYNKTTTQIITDGANWIDSIVQQAKVKKELQEDLDHIIEFRDN